MSYDINYDDQRFKDVEADKKEAISETEKLYSGMIDESDQYYQAQINASKEWEKKQTEIQNEQTDFAIEKIEQEKAQTKKDYLKEQSGAYVDWQKQSNEYGAKSEQKAAQGMTNTGYSESSRVSMYNTYQNRVATARESYNTAVLNYNNAIKEARLQNNAALAEIAKQALEEQLKLSLEGFQYKNTLLLEKADKKTELENEYYARYQDVLAQINQENALAEEVRQYNESLALEREQFEWQKAQAEAAKASSSGGGGGGGGGSSSNSNSGGSIKKNSSSGSLSSINKSSSVDLPKETAQSILNLGGPYNADYVAQQVSSGKVTEYTSPSGNTVFKKNSSVTGLPIGGAAATGGTVKSSSSKSSSSSTSGWKKVWNTIKGIFT